ncbi:MAG: hypothetical protein ACR2MN_00040 [Acidimicrobiales bacterium]
MRMMLAQLQQEAKANCYQNCYWRPAIDLHGRRKSRSEEPEVGIEPTT